MSYNTKAKVKETNDEKEFPVGKIVDITEIDEKNRYLFKSGIVLVCPNDDCGCTLSIYLSEKIQNHFVVTNGKHASGCEYDKSGNGESRGKKKYRNSGEYKIPILEIIHGKSNKKGAGGTGGRTTSPPGGGTEPPTRERGGKATVVTKDKAVRDLTAIYDIRNNSQLDDPIDMFKIKDLFADSETLFVNPNFNFNGPHFIVAKKWAPPEYVKTKAKEIENKNNSKTFILKSENPENKDKSFKNVYYILDFKNYEKCKLFWNAIDIADDDYKRKQKILLLSETSFIEEHDDYRIVYVPISNNKCYKTYPAYKKKK